MDSYLWSLKKKSIRRTILKIFSLKSLSPWQIRNIWHTRIKITLPYDFVWAQHAIKIALIDHVTDVRTKSLLKWSFYVILYSLPYRPTLCKTDTSIRRTLFSATEVSVSKKIDYIPKNAHDLAQSLIISQHSFRVFWAFRNVPTVRNRLSFLSAAWPFI